MLIRLQQLIRNCSGLSISCESIEHALRQYGRHGGADAIERHAASITAGSEALRALLETLVVPETWFFRDPVAFEMATQHVQEKLNSGAKLVRILSLPCSTGEEPYSMAMALREADIAPANVVIEAIDISAVALSKARHAIFPKNAFRSNDLSFRQRYFTCSQGDWHLQPAIAETVQFRQANLLTLVATELDGRFDVILCRNLLIYFDDATQQQAAARLQCLLADDGILLSGHAETMVFCQRYFESAGQLAACVLRKKSISTSRTAFTTGARQTRLRSPASVPGPGPAAAPVPVIPAPRIKPAAPADPLAQARLLADRGDLPMARARLQELLSQQPALAEAHFLMGLITEQQHDDAAADRHWQRALYLDPDHYQALCNLVLLARRRNDGNADLLQQRAARVFARLAKRSAENS